MCYAILGVGGLWCGNAEFSGKPFMRGIVGMARQIAPEDASPEEIEAANNTGDSQFFIMYAYTERLNGNFTAWGIVIDGMEHIDALKKGDRDINNGVIAENPDKIIRMRVAADIWDELE